MSQVARMRSPEAQTLLKERSSETFGARSARVCSEGQAFGAALSASWAAESSSRLQRRNAPQMQWGP